jgi:nitrogen fixation NifU-like protein
MSELDGLYREVILEHARSPRHRAAIAEPTLVHRGSNALCGDAVELSLRLEGDRVTSVGLAGQGCAISQASASIMADLVEGRSFEEIEADEAAFKRMLSGDGEVDEERLGDAAALHDVRRFPRRVKCVALAWTTLHEALDLYQRRTSA